MRVCKEVLLIILFLSSFSFTIPNTSHAHTDTMEFTARSSGTVSVNSSLTLTSFPNPSKRMQPVILSGNSKTSDSKPISQRIVTVAYSIDLMRWKKLGEVKTDQKGSYLLNWTPTSSGQYYIRANATGKVIVQDHVVADYIVAQDGSGDLPNIQTAITNLPITGGIIFIKDGTYLLSTQLIISKRSNVAIIGNGYNTKITKSSGLLLRIENVSNLTIKKLHFHHLTNNHYQALSVRGFNDGITIDTCWFMRDSGPLEKYVDLVWFNPNGTTKNLQIKNSYFKDSQIDALAIKKVESGIVENNTIIDTATNTVKGLGSGMTIEGSSNLTIRKNSIRRTGTQSMGGINIFGNSENIHVENNTIINVQWGVNLCQVSNISVERNRIIDPFASGIRAEETSNVRIIKNYIAQVEFYRYVAGIFTIKNYNILVTGNKVTSLRSGIVVLSTNIATISFNSIDLKAKTFASNKHGVLIYNSSTIKINNNTIIRAYDRGLSISSSRYTVISGNVIAENQQSGIRLINSNNSLTIENVLKNNGRHTSIAYGRNGIDIVDSFNVTFKWNRAFDDQSTKTQLYGLAESGLSDYNLVIENDFRLNGLSAMFIIGSNTVVKDNLP